MSVRLTSQMDEGIIIIFFSNRGVCAVRCLE
jgi:hypothetical protein